MTIDLTDDSGIRSREAYELMAGEVHGRGNLLLLKEIFANHLRDSEKKILACGKAISILRYFYN